MCRLTHGSFAVRHNRRFSINIVEKLPNNCNDRDRLGTEKWEKRNRSSRSKSSVRSFSRWWICNICWKIYRRIRGQRGKRTWVPNEKKRPFTLLSSSSIVQTTFLQRRSNLLNLMPMLNTRKDIDETQLTILVTFFFPARFLLYFNVRLEWYWTSIAWR